MEDKKEKRNRARREKTSSRLRAAAREKMENFADKDFSLIDKIKDSPFYGKVGNDERARKIIDEDIKNTGTNIVPGQLILFKYFDPLHREELEYYDASPCTIFFGIYNGPSGKRIIGFNLHYYPPKIRYQVLNRIFEIYKSFYLKHFDKKTRARLSDISYKSLINELKKAKLDFGIREYVPNLCGDVKIIPPKYWQIVVFTEGWFKKTTRKAIMNYWKNFK